LGIPLHDVVFCVCGDHHLFCIDITEYSRFRITGMPHHTRDTCYHNSLFSYLRNTSQYFFFYKAYTNYLHQLPPIPPVQSIPSIRTLRANEPVPTLSLNVECKNGGVGFGGECVCPYYTSGAHCENEGTLINCTIS
jgi:hypothetical protein